MKKALISTTELRETGYRVAEVVDTPFEVYKTLFWVDCADDVIADQFWYDPADQTIKPIPAPPEPEPASDQPATSGTQTL